MQLPYEPPSFIQDEEEEILFWTGPPNPPPSPVLCNEKIFVTDPVFRQPRQAVHKDGKMKSTNASVGVHKIAQNVGMFRDKGSTAGGNPESSTEKSSFEEFEVQTENKSTQCPPKTTVSQRGNSSIKKDTDCPERCKEQRRTTSNHMPPVDPLCHIPIVTPPCPIKPVKSQTPTELRTYTHVSLLLPPE